MQLLKSSVYRLAAMDMHTMCLFNKTGCAVDMEAVLEVITCSNGREIRGK